MNTKEMYQTPDIEIVELDLTDVIASSPVLENPTEGEEQGW